MRQSDNVAKTGVVFHRWFRLTREPPPVETQDKHSILMVTDCWSSSRTAVSRQYIIVLVYIMRLTISLPPHTSLLLLLFYIRALRGRRTLPNEVCTEQDFLVICIDNSYLIGARSVATSRLASSASLTTGSRSSKPPESVAQWLIDKPPPLVWRVCLISIGDGPNDESSDVADADGPEPITPGPARR